MTRISKCVLFEDTYKKQCIYFLTYCEARSLTLFLNSFNKYGSTVL